MPATAPQLLDAQRTGSALRVKGRVPEDLLDFEGHFPGHPLVPGVVQLHWAIELAREQLGLAGAPSALEALKFREPLLPDQPFELFVDAARGLRFEFSSGGRSVSSGRVGFHDEPVQHTPEPLPPTPIGPWPLRLPHAGRMRLVERVLAHDAGTTLCEARLGDAAPLLRDGLAPSWLALELLAQAMAAQGGIAASGSAAGRQGLLVGARRIELRTRGFASGEVLWVRAQHLRGETGFVVCECAVGTGKPPAGASDARDLALALGTLTAFVQSATD